jgi:exosortase
MRLKIHLRFVVWAVFAIIAWWPSLRSLVVLAFRNEDYSYTLLAFIISGLLLCLEPWSPPLRQCSLRSALLTTCALIPAAWWNYHARRSNDDFRLTISILLFVIFILLMFARIYGRESFARMRFPLLLLFLGVPLPIRVTVRLVAVLQRGSAEAAYALFRFFRVPVVREGLVFSFSNIDVEVTKECSGIRSATILFVTTLVLAQTFLKSGWNKAIAVICSVPIAVAKNGTRIFVLSLLGEYVSDSWLRGPLHRRGGFVFFTAAMASVLVIIWLLHRFEKQAKRIMPVTPPCARGGAS